MKTLFAEFKRMTTPSSLSPALHKSSMMTRHPRPVSSSQSDSSAETCPSIAHHSGCPSLRSSTTSSRSSTRSSTSSPSVLTAVAWSMALLLVFSCLEMASAKSGVLLPALSKRSFLEISCKGVYDKSIYARLDRICEDCYNLFREPQLHSLCRKDCFTSDYFKGCIDVLLLHDEVEQIQTWIKQLHGADPLV